VVLQLGFGREAYNPSPYKRIFVQKVIKILGPGRIIRIKDQSDRLWTRDWNVEHKESA
jgi:hypothetical protein